MTQILTTWKCDPQDCKRRGSDNEFGEHAFIAPVKTKFFNSAVLENKQRGAMACLLFVCLISFELTSTAVQLSNPKRITAMQVGSATEGARVTIVSDSALSDYEAFRRGDRFYVKIPSAEFTSAVPYLRADGFEDVQGQRVGDSVIVSFKLQPGASARVDQRSNRLDVIFSAPGRNLFNPASGPANRASDTRTSLDRGADAAGPLPPGSAENFREGGITGNSRPGSGRRVPQNSLLPNNVPADANTLSTSNVAVNSPSTVVSPSSILAPAVPPTSKTVVNTNAADEAFNWKSRGRVALQWVSANRLVTFLGALILLSLILYLARVLPRWRRNVRAKRVDVPKVQEKVQSKYSAAVDFDQVGGDDALPKTTASDVPAEFAKKPSIASASAAADSDNHAWMLTKPSVTSPTAGLRKHEEEEREVFEL